MEPTPMCLVLENCGMVMALEGRWVLEHQCDPMQSDRQPVGEMVVYRRPQDKLVEMLAQAAAGPRRPLGPVRAMEFGCSLDWDRSPPSSYGELILRRLRHLYYQQS